MPAQGAVIIGLVTLAQLIPGLAKIGNFRLAGIIS
jgi:hypothetical protein